MVNLPLLTISVLTYKRPHYTIPTLYALMNQLGYQGDRRYVISDGGSSEADFEMYRTLLNEQESPYAIVENNNGDFSTMLNNAILPDSEMTLLVLDDFVLKPRMDITKDVRFLMENEDVGLLRYGRMNAWDVPTTKLYAELRDLEKTHYWVMDKERSTASYMWTLGFSLMHKRMWDIYGPLDATKPHRPGAVELEMTRRFKDIPGPTIGFPMRLGQASDMLMPMGEVIEHIGNVRTEEYTKESKSRWGAI